MSTETVPENGLVRARSAKDVRGAIYAVDVMALRGAIGRITSNGWDYIVDRSNIDFRPLFGDVDEV